VSGSVRGWETRSSVLRSEQIGLNTIHPWISRRRPNALDAEAEYSWFYQAEYTNVARSVFLILHDRPRAEDIAQDAFVQLYAHWWKVSRYERPDAWVRRVAIRMAVRHVKRERRRAVLERDVDEPTLRGPVDVDLLRAIGALPAAQRVAVVLFYFEDRPIAEIADVLGSSEGAVKMSLQRARRGLAELLTEEVGDDVHRP
jgi:RNA polymerase sigma factor (sigma-70 family)